MAQAEKSKPLYTRYPIVARALRRAPLGRVRRASKGILHTIKTLTLYSDPNHNHNPNHNQNPNTNEKFDFLS